jgi:hypothetical protein
MRKTLIVAIGVTVALAVTASLSQAATITQMLGTANYTNGETVGTGTFASNPSGDPAPFDRLIGDKTNGPNPSTSFTFSAYGGPIAAPISSATIEFGLYDAASPSPSTEVQFFTLNGTDNASVLTAALVADPATRWSRPTTRSICPAPTSLQSPPGHRPSPSGSRVRVRACLDLVTSSCSASISPP